MRRRSARECRPPSVPLCYNPLVETQGRPAQAAVSTNWFKELEPADPPAGDAPAMPAPDRRAVIREAAARAVGHDADALGDGVRSGPLELGHDDVGDVVADRVALPQGNRQVVPLIAQVGIDGRQW